jgi:hypothetical protein
MILYIWRKAILLGLSLEIPIKVLIDIMSIDIKILETEDFTVQAYEIYFHSKEI